MSLFKGNLNSGGLFTAQDDVRGLRLTAPGTAPAYVALETADGVTWYLYINDDDEWIMHTSAPTAGTAGIGNIITGAGNSGANTTLSNITSAVAIPESLQSDTTLTDDLGDASYYWKSLYARDLYLNSTATMKGTTAGTIDIIGKMVSGASDTGYDWRWYGATATSWMEWDESEDGLTFEDDTYVKVGTGNDLIIYSDGTDVHLDATTDDTIWNIGGSNDTDVKFHSHDNADWDCGWISDIYTFQICTDAILRIGGAAFDTVTDGVTLKFSATNSELNIDAYSANDSVRFGRTTITDVQFDGANGYDVVWDGSADTMIYNDNSKIKFGSTDVVMYSDGTLLQVEVSGTTGGINIPGYADQTTSIITIDGSTNNWDGANDVGMLHLKNDVALANAGAAMLYLKSSGTPIAAAEGYMARFESLDAASTGTYAMQAYVDKNHVMQMESGGTCSTVLTLTNNATSLITSTFKVGSSQGSFIGADDTGLVHIRNSSSGAHVGATLLMVESTGLHIASAEGFMARFVDTGTAVATATAVEIEVASGTRALHANGAAIFDNGYQSGSVAIVPADDGSRTQDATIATGNQCPEGIKHFTLGHAGATSVLFLPTATVGREVHLLNTGGTGYELQSSTGALCGINGSAVSSSNNESAIAGSMDLVICRCVGSTSWLVVAYGSTGDYLNVEASASG
jgi:hypothetical protein